MRPIPDEQFPVTGRFAPSPTGPLHFGSLVAALASFLSARRAGGRWLVRIEDVDAPRTVPGAARAMLAALVRFGLHWDGPVLWQSQRSAAYAEALEQLRRAGWVYACRCSRRDISALARPGAAGPVYPGTCRARALPWVRNRAVRLIESGPVIHYRDGIQGPQIQDLAAEVGDFVLRRADGLFAYQLAVVVDDAAQGVTDVVRGADLLLSTPRQIRLQQRLGLPTPQYAHLPVVLNGAGQKLSKQSGAEALCFADPAEGLTQALRFLGHEPPRELGREPVLCVLDWALANWQLGAVPTASRQFAPRPV